MLNNLTPEMLRQLHLQEEQDEHEQYQQQEPDVEKGQADYSKTSREPIPADVREQDRRPITQAKHDDGAESSENLPSDIPPDVRRESMRPTTKVMPEDRRDDRPHNLTSPRSKSRDTTDTGRQSQEQNVAEDLEKQATEPGHTEPDRGKEPQARELRNKWAR